MKRFGSSGIAVAVLVCMLLVMGCAGWASSSRVNYSIVGAKTATGVASEITAPYLTTGTALKITLLDAILNGGYYIRCMGGTAGAPVEAYAVGDGGTLTAAGQVTLSRTAKTVPIIANTITDYDAQAATATIAALLGGIVTQNSKTGASTITTPTGTEISAGITGVATGDSFTVTYYNRGNQTSTITAGASGVTILGTAAVPTLKTAIMKFICTGANAWSVYVTLSA